MITNTVILCSKLCYLWQKEINSVLKERVANEIDVRRR